MITLTPISQYSGVSATCTITLPAINVYLKDANFVTLKSEAVGRKVVYSQYTVGFDGDILKTYKAQVYGDILIINIGSLFTQLDLSYQEMQNLYLNRISVIGNITCDDGTTATFNTSIGFGQTFKVYDGYTLPNRSHGTDTAGFVPPEDIGDPCISMLSTVDCLVSNGKETPYLVEGGNLFSVCKPEDGCMSVVDVTKLVMDKPWDTLDTSWTFGINAIIIDRVVVENDNFGITKILTDEGFDDNFIFSMYSPLSVILTPTSDVGVWRVQFFSNRVDDGQRHIIMMDKYNGYMFYLKEEGDRSLFAQDWGDHNYAVTAPQFKIYYAPIWNGTGFDIYDYTPVDFTLRPYVGYDDNTYSDVNPSYETFYGRPLCAIRYFTAMGFYNTNRYDYDYVVHIDNYGGFDAYANCWMFGNHLNYSSAKDPEMNWFLTNMDAIYFYGTVSEVGCGLMTLYSYDENIQPANYNEFYSIEILNKYGRKLLVHNSLWYHLWCFFNSDLARNPELHLWSWDDLSHQFIIRLTGSRYYKKNIDVAAKLPEWAMGIPIIDMYKVETTLKLADETILVVPTRDLIFYPVYSFPDAYGNILPTYKTSLIKLTDGINFYHYDGTTCAEEDADFVRITFDAANYVNVFYNFYYTGNDLMLGYNIANNFEGVGGVGCQYFRIFGDEYATYGGFSFMPFVCGVPFVQKRESANSAQFSRVNLVTESGTHNPDYNYPHQILQIERYYDTFTNIGNFGQVQTSNISKGYTGNDKNLTLNTYTLSRFVNIDDLYSQMGWAKTLHIENFNSYGAVIEEPYLYVGDGSFVIMSGCADTQNAGGDIVNGAVTNYTAYAFDTCSMNKVVWIKYKNMDGLWRYLPAEIMEQSYTNQRQDLQRLTPSLSPINAYPLWKPYGLVEKITVFVGNIPQEMHIEDMLYSTPLMLYSHDGEFPIYVALEEDTITRNLREDSENFVLHFIKKQ